MSAQGSAQNGSGANASNSSEGQSGGSQDNQAAAQKSGQQDGQEQGQEIAKADSQVLSQKDGQGETPGNEKANSQNEDQSQDSQQTELSKNRDPSDPAVNQPPAPPIEAEEESTAGAAQNALEYLTGENAQAGDDVSEEGETGQTEGTLTIQDLLNAQGVGSDITEPVDEKTTDETTPDKDGDS